MLRLDTLKLTLELLLPLLRRRLICFGRFALLVALKSFLELSLA
jgi:hypothetical protein